MEEIKAFTAPAGGTPPQGNSPTKTPPLSISPKAGINETCDVQSEFGSYCIIVASFAFSAENSLLGRSYSLKKNEDEEKTKLDQSMGSYDNISQVESELAPELSGTEQSPHPDERIDRVSVENGSEVEFNEDKQDHEQKEQDVDIRVEDTATDVNVEVSITFAQDELPSTVERDTDALPQATEPDNVQDNHAEPESNRETLAIREQLTSHPHSYSTSDSGGEARQGSEDVDLDEPTYDRNEELSSALPAERSSTNLEEVQPNPQDNSPQNLITGIFIHRCVYCWPHMVHLRNSDHFVAIKKFIINRFVEVKVYMVPNMDYGGVCWHDIHIQVTVKGDMLNRIRLGVAKPEIATETTVYGTDGQVIGESPTVHETHRITNRFLNYSCSLINTATLQTYRKKKLKVKIDFRLYPNYALRTQLDHQDEVLVISRLNL